MQNSDQERSVISELDGRAVRPNHENSRISKNGQVLVEKTRMPSTTHPFAKIWKARCSACGITYGVNSCDFHIRRCPSCQGGEPGEPIELSHGKSWRSEGDAEDESRTPSPAQDLKTIGSFSAVDSTSTRPTSQPAQPAAPEAIRSPRSPTLATTRPNESAQRYSPRRTWFWPFVLGAVLGLIALAGTAYFLDHRADSLSIER